MKFSSDSPPDPLGTGPRFDRRALERAAVGAPPPPPAPSTPAIERGARVTSGWPARPIRHSSVSLPRNRPTSNAPSIAIGRPRERSKSGQDLSGEPLYLLIPDEATRSSGAGAPAAIAAADRFAGARPVYLIDLDLERRDLTRFASGGPDGIAEALEFGLSLDAIGTVLASGATLVGIGHTSPMEQGLAGSDGWDRLIRKARRDGARILVYLPLNAGVDLLASRAGAALLLTTPEEETRLASKLPPALPVVGAIAPDLTDIPEPPADSPSSPAPDAPQGDLGPGSGPQFDSEPDLVAEPTPLDEDSGASSLEIDSVDELIGTDEDNPPDDPTLEAVPSSESADVEPRRTTSSTSLGAWLETVAKEAEDEAGSEDSSPPVEEESAPAIDPATAHDVEDPDLLAPTARGLTLAQWLAEEEIQIGAVASMPVAPSPAPEAAPRPEADRIAGNADDAAPEESAPESHDTATSEAADRPSAQSKSSVRADGRQSPDSPPPSRYSVPRTSARAEGFIRIASVVILCYWTYYIGWRWLETLNYDALWFSIPLVLAESWGWITACFLVLTVWKLNHRTSVPAPAGLDVDVFITTYDEPLEVIRRTTLSAREIRYPHRTYVLDDGRREEVRAMAKSLGVDYIRRDNNDHAKAGNLNNALEHTSGDFILQLDADHAPLPHILDRLLGFFNDDKVAFVQTPQDFYNMDSFTSHVDEETQSVWEEQKLFFSVLQPGKDHWNAAFFCGSCAVIRRGALDDIGGFSVETVTEDVETSLLLHSRGWKSIYFGESLAYGLAAGSAAAFHIQQGRWARGSMQVLRRFNPLTYRGLTPSQRIGYFYSLTSFCVGLQKLIFYSSPLVFLFTGILPIAALDGEFLRHFLPYLVLSISLYELIARGMGFTWVAERYQMAKFWTYTRAMPAYFSRSRLGFKVTPKGFSDVPFRTYAPHITLMVLSVIAVYWATLASNLGWIEYPVDGWRSLAFQANFVWILLNFVLAAYVVRLSIKLQHKRQDHRFADRFPIYIRPRGRHSQLGEEQLALTEDLNSHGLSFRSVKPFETDTVLSLKLPLSTREISINGTVVHVRPDPRDGVEAFFHGVEFRNVPLDVRDAIELHIAHHAVPMRKLQYQPANSLSSAGPWSTERQGRRRRVRLPTWVLVGGPQEDDQKVQNIAFLEEVGPGGGSLIMDDPVAPDTPIIFEVPGTTIRGEGRTVYSHAMETPIGVRFVVGVRTIEPSELKRSNRFSLRRFLVAGRRAAVAGLLVSASLFGSAASAHSQVVVNGTAEGDSRDQSLLLVGATLQPPTESNIRPYGALLAYRVIFQGESGREIIDAAVPSVGISLGAQATTIQLGIGYLFAGASTQPTLGGPGGTGEGVVVNGSASQGLNGMRAEVAASYNLGDEYLWTRGRGSRPVSLDVGYGSPEVGAEVIFQGGGAGTSFHSFQFAPTFSFGASPNLNVLSAFGWKTDDLDRTRGGGFPYLRLELLYFVR